MAKQGHEGVLAGVSNEGSLSLCELRNQQVRNMDPACLLDTLLRIKYEVGQVEISLNGILLEILVGGKKGSEARLTAYLWCPSWRSPGQVSSKQMCYLKTSS